MTDENDRLRWKVLELQQFIVCSMPPRHLAQLLQRYSEGRADDENVTDKIIEAAEFEPYPSNGLYAPCPLCRHRTQQAGFKLPEGLRRHLIGEGKAAPCKVFRAAFELHPRRGERADGPPAPPNVRDVVKDRAASKEPLYQTGPQCPGQLKDEVRWYGYRRKEDLQAVETRLEALGFTKKVEGRVHSYTRPWIGYVIYADPRMNDRVRYNVCDDSAEPAWSFDVMDNWEKADIYVQRRLDDYARAQGYPVARGPREEE